MFLVANISFDRNLKVHRLGNLVPLDSSQNAGAGNRTYKEKMDYFLGASGKKKVTPFTIVTELAHHVKQWTYKEYKKRHQELLSLLRSHLKLPEEEDANARGLLFSGSPIIASAVAAKPTGPPSKDAKEGDEH